MLAAAHCDDSSRQGLSTAEAGRLLAETDANEITRDAGRPSWRLLLAQFSSPVVLLLLAACVLPASLGKIADAIAIGLIVIINGLVGFVQEHRTERAVLALRSMTAPRARVIRDGHAQVIPASVVVPADLPVLEGGDIVAADARLIASANSIGDAESRADARVPRDCGYGRSDRMAARTMLSGLRMMSSESAPRAGFEPADQIYWRNTMERSAASH